ncbi:hypothetical protein [Ruicaihuangia caeni]|uniref:LapA family protein n=1 Tax=Ruicaihuangia caeni TaxID=3042517 RepID=A0AAW6T8M1_9MICO|nr:hypothetical protein [Klugiella sp. YN-L-19]MDI2098408.1 hypothetical protein [Klugiella sp. YN-L-19]
MSVEEVVNPSLADVLLIWVPVVFAVIVGVVGVLTLTVIVPPARERLRLERLRMEIERRAEALERESGPERRSREDVSGDSEADAEHEVRRDAEQGDA